MADQPLRRGAFVVLADGEIGVVVFVADDGAVQIKTTTGIIVSSILDEAQEEDAPGNRPAQ